VARAVGNPHIHAAPSVFSYDELFFADGAVPSAPPFFAEATPETPIGGVGGWLPTTVGISGW